MQTIGNTDPRFAYRFYRGGFVGPTGHVVGTINIHNNVTKARDAYAAATGATHTTTPRRRDTFRVRGNLGDYKVCRVRSTRGVNEVVCTNGANTLIVPMLALAMGFVEHYRDGVKIAHERR